MIDFILLLIIGSLWIWGIFALFDEGNLLWPIRKRIEDLGLGMWIKPLFSCPYCCASVHGLLISAYFYGPSLVTIPYIICLCGLNFIIKEYLYP
jgi:hypothetical protein